jgi:hypothetical protein
MWGEGMSLPNLTALDTCAVFPPHDNINCTVQFITNILLSNLGLLVLVVGYAVGGAYVFMWLEKDNEDLMVSKTLCIQGRQGNLRRCQ